MNTKISRNRFRPSRRGSVLILVVALLVLMALIGTAWISTARVDRAASIETSRTTEAEMLAEGLKNIINAVIVADTATAGMVRSGAGFAPSDGNVADKYLASRVPVFLDETVPEWDP